MALPFRSHFVEGRKRTSFWNFCGATCTLELDCAPITRRYKVFAFIIETISTWNQSMKGYRRTLLFIDAFETSVDAWEIFFER